MTGMEQGLHAVCLVSSIRLRKVLERALRAAGYELQPKGDGTPATEVDLLFIDQEHRQNIGNDAITKMMAPMGNVIILGDSLADDEIVELLQRDGLNHLISEHQSPDEAELLVTTVKLASGDIFGVEKYLPWGAKIHERNVSNYEDKSAAINEIVAHAKSMGARSAVMARLEQVVDELLMNAMYDAPAAREGHSTVDQMDAIKDGRQENVSLRYGCDGRYLVVSAADNYGELRKNDIFQHVARARSERAPKEDRRNGAGLGLFIVLSSVNRFIANIDKGNKTEVVCVFDLMQSGRNMENVAKSVHVFNRSVA